MTLAFKVLETPLNSPVKLGQVLSTQEIAQLLEINASDLAIRGSMASEVSLNGFRFKILESQERE